MKKALIISDVDSLHTVNFINSILINNKTVEKIDLFSTCYDCNVRDEYREFYINNNINIIYTGINKCDYKLINRIRYIIKKTFSLLLLTKNNHYCYCFILYCSLPSAIWGYLCAKKTNKIIPVFWGGDVLRNNRLNDLFFNKMLSSSYKIIMPNINSYDIFNKKTNNKYINKTVVIQYPQKMIHSLLEAEENLDVKNYKEMLGLPSDKKIIICGHTATRAENYLEIIKELQKCESTVLQDCFFVFMMTYSPEEYRSYQTEVETALEASTLNGVVFKEFIPYKEILKLHYLCDIHITAIVTDAFSCFLQEELFSGSILLYGKWLNYYEIENDDFFAIPFEKISDLTACFSDVIINYDFYKNRSIVNRQGIINLASEENILKEWNRQVFNK